MEDNKSKKINPQIKLQRKERREKKELDYLDSKSIKTMEK